MISSVGPAIVNGLRTAPRSGIQLRSHLGAQSGQPRESVAGDRDIALLDFVRERSLDHNDFFEGDPCSGYRCFGSDACTADHRGKASKAFSYLQASTADKECATRQPTST